MNTQEIMDLTSKYVMTTYGRLPIAFVKGEGAKIWDADGNQYLDFVAGIAVLSVGHCHPKVVAALKAQSEMIWHTSNLYHIAQQAQLAQKLSELSFGGKAFFCNSGAEANEAAIKLARKWAMLKRPEVPGNQRTILTALQSFHGRSVTTITATGQPKYQKGFEPLTEGFEYFAFGDIDDMKEKWGEGTIAVMLEPIQAEGGVNVPPAGFLQQVREQCDRMGALLIYDEVQTGMCRTGKWFGYQHEGVTPDIMTLAKALGNGYPIGACLATGEVSSAFEPGNHASTFGGSHLACAVALATIEVMLEENIAAHAEAMGQVLAAELSPDKHAQITEVRGRGLLRAVCFTEDIDARVVQEKCRELGLIVNALGTDRLRLAPPLTITEAEIKQAVEIILQAVEAAV